MLSITRGHAAHSSCGDSPPAASASVSRPVRPDVAIPAGPMGLPGALAAAALANTLTLLLLPSLLAMVISVPGVGTGGRIAQVAGATLAQGAASEGAQAEGRTRARRQSTATAAADARDRVDRGILAQSQASTTGGIRPQSGPGTAGEIRAVWMELPPMEQKQGKAAIRQRMPALARAGLNAVFFWCSSTSVEALRASSHAASSPPATWDALGVAIREGHAAGVKIHAWYSPVRYKETFRAVELRKHPAWAAVDSAGRPSDAAICLTRPEAREYEVEAAIELVRRHPDLDGVHIEEPGYPSGPYCFCDVCRQAGRQLLGFDIKTRPADGAVATLKAFVCTEFVRELRERLRLEAPGVAFSVTGGFDPASDFLIGRDWGTWVRRGYLDFYVPQIYTNSRNEFLELAAGAVRAAGAYCPVVAGIVTSRTAFMPKRESTVELLEQIGAARRIGMAGFVLFSDKYLSEEELKVLSGLKAARARK